MWIYEKQLQHPVNIKNPNPRLAKVILSQLGGPDGELGAANRYLNQRYTMPMNEGIAVLTDIGSEDKKRVEKPIEQPIEKTVEEEPEPPKEIPPTAEEIEDDGLETRTEDREDQDFDSSQFGEEMFA